MPARKRARSDDGPDGNESAPMPRRCKTTPMTIKKDTRNIKFKDVYCNGKPVYKHMIVEYPSKSARFYILRCDEHVVHFNKNPLHGAAKHLHSMQHGYMPKDYERAVDLLGHRVPDCTHELADLNNDMVLAAFGKGYKPLNANHMNNSKRRAYELEHGVSLGATPETAPSFANLKNWNAKRQTAAQPAAQPAATRVETPVAGDMYLVFWNEDKRTYPVMILPSQGPLERYHLPNESIFHPPDHGPQPPSKTGDRAIMTAAPRCYAWDAQAGQIVGWAPGFEDGGSRVSEREFPVMFFDEGRNFGSVPLRELLPFNFNDPQYHEIPYFNDAVEHYAKVRGFGSSKKMMAVADGLDPRTGKLISRRRPPTSAHKTGTVRAPPPKPIPTTNAQHARPQPPPQSQATPGVPSSAPPRTRQERGAGTISNDQQNKSLVASAKEVAGRRDGAKRDSPSMAMSNQDEDIEMPDSATFGTPFTNGPSCATLVSHPPLPDRRASGKPESPSVAMDEKDDDVPMGNTEKPTTAIPAWVYQQGRHGDERASLLPAPTQTRDLSQGVAKNDSRPAVLIYSATTTPVQSTHAEPQPANMGLHLQTNSPFPLLPHLSSGLPARPVVSEPGGRIESPPAILAPPAPYTGPVVPSQAAVPSQSRMLGTNWWESYGGSVATEPQYNTAKIPATELQYITSKIPATETPFTTSKVPTTEPQFLTSKVPTMETHHAPAMETQQVPATERHPVPAMEPPYITSKVPAMAPWVAADQPNPPVQPRSSVEMPPSLSLMVPATTSWVAVNHTNPASQPQRSVDTPPLVSPVVPAMTFRAAVNHANPPVEAQPSVEMPPARIPSPVVPTMAPRDAANHANSASQSRPSVEMPPLLSPAATPAGSAVATPTLSRPGTGTSQPASPWEARPGSVPRADAKKERASGQGECFDVSLYSDASRTVHRLTVDLESKMASAPSSSLVVSPQDVKEAIVDVLETNPSSRMVKVVWINEESSMTLVFEAADMGSGKLAGSVHARRFYAWLMRENRAMKFTNNW